MSDPGEQGTVPVRMTLISRREQMVRTVDMEFKVSGHPDITDRGALRVKNRVTPELVKVKLTQNNDETDWFASVLVYGSMPHTLIRGWAEYGGRPASRSTWPVWLRELVERFEP